MARSWPRSRVGLIALGAAAAVAISPAASSSKTTPRLVKLGGGGTYKPRSYCPANHTCFKHATWTWWGSRTAKARANAHTVYPGAEPGVSGRITFTFDRPRNICGGRYFTRARWRYTSSEPYTEATVVAGGACYWSGA